MEMCTTYSSCAMGTGPRGFIRIGQTVEDRLAEARPRLVARDVVVPRWSGTPRGGVGDQRQRLLHLPSAAPGAERRRLGVVHHRRRVVEAHAPAPSSNRLGSQRGRDGAAIERRDPTLAPARGLIYAVLPKGAAMRAKKGTGLAKKGTGLLIVWTDVAADGAPAAIKLLAHHPARGRLVVVPEAR
jgi:hypothetical protein